MFDLYLTEPFVPFTIALCLLFGLLALEIIMSFLGGTVLGLGADADLDVDLPDLGDMDIDFGDVDPELFDVADPEIDADVASEGPDAMSAGPASWLGIGRMPALIWLAALLLGFGLTGVVLQALSQAILGSYLPISLVGVISAVAGITFARQFGAVFARLLPKTETTAMDARHLGRRTGIVTQGTAKRGKPSEVKVKDRHGNIHYLRAEPLKDADEIPVGTEVLVLRHRLNEGYRIVPVGPVN